MSITAPTCKICKTQEWGHVCSNTIRDTKKLAKQAAPVKAKQKFGQGKRAR